MSKHNSYAYAPTKTVVAGGTTYAYRELGPTGDIPVIFLAHLAANLDNWDPRIVDPIARDRHVIAFDNTGVGASSGKVPATVLQAAADAYAFIRALGFDTVDIFGFSLGGMIAQDLAIAHPQLVRKMVLAGTGPRGGRGLQKIAGVTFYDIARATLSGSDPKEFLFFNRDAAGKKAGKQFLERLNERSVGRDRDVAPTAFLKQLSAIRKYGRSVPSDLSAITQPTLIANGDNDRMVPSVLSEDLHRRIANSELIIYPNSGHGGIFQFHEEFAPAAARFLASDHYASARSTERRDEAETAIGPASTTATEQRAVQLRVENVIKETSDAFTLVLSRTHAGGPTGFGYRPGQFLTLEVPHAQHVSVARCYSLSSSPDSDTLPAISVKRTEHGYASNWLCDNAIVGLTLSALPPAGTFVPSRWDRPLVLLAAGSGITPIMSILKTALTTHDQHVTLIYANRSPQSVMFADTLKKLAQRYPTRLTVTHWFESERGLPTLDGLSDAVPSNSGSDAYLCGPTPFMDLAHDALVTVGIERDAIHREVFMSIKTNPFLDATTHVSTDAAANEGTPVTAEVAGTSFSFLCPPDTVLLDAMLAQGIDAPFGCREGVCGACVFTLAAGEVEMRANETLGDHELEKGKRLACQSVPTSDTVDIVIE
ncbi:alpha/beta fold hydrolase [Rhodococcus fascians]|nr:alpha/beta fold hydrolase [Rhodococcus fascians]